MGQTSCCGNKHPSFNNLVKTPSGNSKTSKVQECHPTNLFQKSEDDLMNEELICSICLGVVRDAVKDPCGHVYGESCIKNWLKKNPKCPYSQRALTCGQLKADKIVRKKVQRELKSPELVATTQPPQQLATLKIEIQASC